MFGKMTQILNLAFTAILLTSTIVFYVEYNPRPVYTQSLQDYIVQTAKS